jgi:hypothetical protein
MSWNVHNLLLLHFFVIHSASNKVVTDLIMVKDGKTVILFLPNPIMDPIKIFFEESPQNSYPRILPKNVSSPILGVCLKTFWSEPHLNYTKHFMFIFFSYRNSGNNTAALAFSFLCKTCGEKPSNPGIFERQNI